MEKQDTVPSGTNGNPPAYSQHPNYAPPEYKEQGYVCPPGYQPVAMGNTDIAPTKTGFGHAPGTVVIDQPATVVIHTQQQQPKMQSTVGVLTLSCLVVWCCFFPFGLIAFVFAVLAHRSAKTVETERYIRISKAFSTAGFMCGFFIILTMLYFYFTLRFTPTVDCLLPDTGEVNYSTTNAPMY